MKHFLSFFLVLSLSLSFISCQKDDLSWIQEIESIKTELVNQKKLIEALQSNANIIGIETNGDSYTIKFSNGQSITLTNGKTPFMTIGDNGNWNINGEDTGCPSRGSDGEDGKDGSDGITPTIEIVDGNWWINGNDTGIKAEGKDGISQPIIIQIIDMNDYVVFIFSDNSSITCHKMYILNDDMYVQKDKTKLDVYIKTKDKKYINYPLILRRRDFKEGLYPAFYDNWGLYRVAETYVDGDTFSIDSYLFNGGEAEMAMMAKTLDDEFQFIGGSNHGFEMIDNNNGERMISFDIDNYRYKEDDIIDLRSVSVVKITQKTLLFHPYTNENPFAKVIKCWEFKDGYLDITCQVEFLEDVTLSNTYFGMMCVYRHIEGKKENGYLTKYAYKDNEPFSKYEVTDDWESMSGYGKLKNADYSCNSITEYGETPRTFKLSSIQDNREKSGGLFISTNAGTYNKMYFANNIGIVQYSQGHILKATTRMTIL